MSADKKKQKHPASYVEVQKTEAAERVAANEVSPVAEEPAAEGGELAAGREFNSAPYMQNRELSWLDFNKRVLDQSVDPNVPLFEQLNFVSIFWSNLQEFFMIRVGSLSDLALVKKQIIDTKSGMTPAEQLDAIYEKCHEIYPYMESCFKGVRDRLAKHGVRNLVAKHLAEEEREFVETFFDVNIMPFLSPQIVNSRHPFPHLENGALYIVVRLDEQAQKDGKDGKDGKKKGAKGAKNKGAEGVTLGIIPLPRQCARIVRIPGSECRFMLLEHVIEMFAEKVFSMYKVKHTNVICVTRNADLDASEGEEEQGEDYREHIKRILKKRTRLAPVRLESERELSATVKPVLLKRLNLKNHQAFVTSVPLDMSYAFQLPALVGESKRERLMQKPFDPAWPACLDRKHSIMRQVTEHEVLLSYPYETMDAFIQLLREAAMDPSVVSIKITLYRLASQSHLAEAIIAAAEAGKDVTALFELRARFDESNNIEWSQRFEAAGCNVIYGFRDYKVHSKICCITRQTPNGLQCITQLGTGNYNEKTARLYTDYSFITCDPAIGRDALEFFRNMTLESLSDMYSTLWVAPLQIKQQILAGIDGQIARARAGLPSGLFFKTNSITDREIIEKIAEASQAGVNCTLLVRGISCIVPGIKGYTDNVCVVSIVGRLLEHSRIYCFGPFDGDVSIYFSSADLMTRNMDKRIEIAWPIRNPILKRQVIGYIGTCMEDTAKLRDLLPSGEYTKIGFYAKKGKDGKRKALFDSQNYLIEAAQHGLMLASESELGRVEERVVETPLPGIPDVDAAEAREAVVIEEGIEAVAPMEESESVSEAASDEFSDAVSAESGLPNINGLFDPELEAGESFDVPMMGGGMMQVPVVRDELADVPVDVDADMPLHDEEMQLEAEPMLGEASELEGAPLQEEWTQQEEAVELEGAPMQEEAPQPEDVPQQSELPQEAWEFQQDQVIAEQDPTQPGFSQIPMAANSEDVQVFMAGSAVLGSSSIEVDPIPYDASSAPSQAYANDIPESAEPYQAQMQMGMPVAFGEAATQVMPMGAPVAFGPSTSQIAQAEAPIAFDATESQPMLQQMQQQAPMAFDEVVSQVDATLQGEEMPQPESQADPQPEPEREAKRKKGFWGLFSKD